VRERGPFFWSLVELTAAYWLTYALLSDGQKHEARVQLYRNIQAVSSWLARRLGELSLWAENRIYAEIV